MIIGREPRSNGMFIVKEEEDFIYAQVRLSKVWQVVS
jgi:hypothetical protein